MSFMGRIAKPRAALNGDIERLIADTYGGVPSATGLTVTTESAMRVGAVYACVLVLAQSVAQLPSHMFKEVGKLKEKAYDHYLYPIIHDQPNEWMTSYEFKHLIMVHLLLRGNSVWLKTVGFNKKIRELIPIHPDRINEIVQDEKYRLFYKIKRPNSPIIDTLPASAVIHFRGMSSDGFTGMNPIQYAREMIGLSMATEKHGAKLFANGATFSGILTHPKSLKESTAKRILSSFNEAYSSVEKAHKTALIEEGMKWEKVSMTADDAQFLESRKYQRSEIAGFYRVPPHMIGDLDKATLNNIELLDLAFVKHSLTPWLVSIEQTLKKDTLTIEEKRSYYYKFSVEGLLRGDIKSRNDAHAVAVQNKWLNANEVRSLEDMNPRDGGDVYENPNIAVKETPENGKNK